MRRFTQAYPFEKFHVFPDRPELFRCQPPPVAAARAVLRAAYRRAWSRNYVHVRICHCLCRDPRQSELSAGQYITAAVKER